MMKNAEAKKILDSLLAAAGNKADAAFDLPTAVRAELRRIISSSAFEASDRNRRFLEYVVEETLAGRSDRIKGYCIATQVFGRDANFNATNDPVVRMEARRIRRALERFYLLDDCDGLVRIAMPKGGYVPEFRTGLDIDRSLERVAIPPHDLTVLVAEFGLEDFSEEGQEQFGDAFARQLTVRLSQYPNRNFTVSSVLPRWVAHRPRGELR